MVHESGNSASIPHPAWAVDARVDVPGASFELRRYAWPLRREVCELVPHYILSMRLVTSQWSGKAQYAADAKHTPCQRIGKSMLLPAHVPLHAAGVGASGRVLTCIFDNGLFERATGLDDWAADRLNRCANIASTQVSQAMARITAELIDPGFGSGMAVEALSRLVLVGLAREFDVKPGAATGQARLAQWQIRRIDDHLNSVEGGWPSAAELAGLCGISASHLSRAFHHTVGVTLKEHAEATRLKRAMALLGDARLPLKQIAATLGFATASAFSAAFRRSLGEAPRQFRCRQKALDR